MRAHNRDNHRFDGIHPGLGARTLAGCSWLVLVGVMLAGGPAHAISRCEAVARAERWVANAVPYSWDAWYTDPSNGQCCYRTDCSALVSASWGLPPPGLTTYHLAGGPWNNGQSYAISAAELLPGDALNYGGDPSTGTGHVMLYIQGDFNAGWVEVIEEYDFGRTAERRWRAIDPGMYVPIRYAGIESCNAAPHGWIDGADCSSLRGWAQDPSAPDAPIDVHLYFDGPVGASPLPGIPIHADRHRDDLCSAIGSCSHGFELLLPPSLRDGQPHQVFAYGIDTAGGDNPLLAGAPLSFECAPPDAPLPPQAGVKRHIVNPDVLVAWRWSGWNVARVDDTVLSAFPTGAPLVSGPVLRRADGDPRVFLIDEDMARWIPGPDVMTAWRFDWGAIGVVPAAQMPLPGPDVLAVPVLYRGSGPEVYLVDSRRRYAAQLVDGALPARAEAGRDTPVALRFSNQGSATWNPGEVVLAPVGPRDSDSVWCAAGSWSSCSRIVANSTTAAPGESVEFVFAIRAPAVAQGTTLRLCLGLVAEPARWFSDPNQGGPADNATCEDIAIGAPDPQPPLDAGVPQTPQDGGAEADDGGPDGAESEGGRDVDASEADSGVDGQDAAVRAEVPSQDGGGGSEVAAGCASTSTRSGVIPAFVLVAVAIRTGARRRRRVGSAA